MSDVFHSGAPDANLWEFKHGNGNFKRGDLVGLREIKRRASRHALVHREYNQKPPSSAPGTPAEPMPLMLESGDSRFTNLNVEHMLHDLNTFQGLLAPWRPPMTIPYIVTVSRVQSCDQGSRTDALRT